MAVARKNGGGAAALAAVLALSQLLLLATHSNASCVSYSPCPKPSPAAHGFAPTPRAATSGGMGRCPVNTLKLGACASVLGGLLNLDLGQQESPASSSSSSPTQPCCQLLGGLADLDAAVCLCTALRANVLGIVQLSLPVKLSVLVNYCGKKVPQGFQCPST
ncbi:hypothetical protein BAE44_0010146 [Dichanthelium oligosanthes]|uniref:Bifunctional inhibitor/plant lipid transfer protein/seed storage helical domain-containing protein n=1 Tax=Dichanthelium oligosanthes TaxID=888268 RepID=A0A1E5VUM0_9POAL|nr:hypothetical protein BAE44_0010146 [Dichanthelium oligosanthes]